MSDKMEYRVNIDLANKTKAGLSEIIDGRDSRLLNKVGAFASLFQIDPSSYPNPVLVLKTEEPGSKQIIAFKHDRIESVCFDMINHLINDCIAMGAEPLGVQDLIVCSKMEKTVIQRIVKACSDACTQQGCILTGGETTEQPDVLPKGTYILGSSIVGVVDKDAIIDGSSIQENDIVLAVKSSGLHSNGYTLVRDLIKQNPEIINEQIDDTTFLESVLIPHHCYNNSLKDVFKKRFLKGIAHITGGGVQENLNRILPINTDALIDKSRYQTQKIFHFIQKKSNMTLNEMHRTFNMGIGLCLVCSPDKESTVISSLKKCGEIIYKIGRIQKGSGNVVFGKIGS